MASSDGTPLPPLPLPEGITSSYVDCRVSCGLNFHVLTSGVPSTNPLVLFCHGFPELAYSWRKVLPAVADAGYYCVAVDQRGYGRTTAAAGSSSSSSSASREEGEEETDLDDFVFTNLVRDLVCLVYGLGYAAVHSIVGHDFGAVSSATAALMRPDLFRSTVQMSHPHHRPPRPRLGNRDGNGDESAAAEKDKKDKNNPDDIQTQLATLDPPRKHYKWYNATAAAAADWARPPQGLGTFLRGYFHVKSADWAGNGRPRPRPLRGWNAEALRVLPEYYVMRRDATMPSTVSRLVADEDDEDDASKKTGRWLSADDLGVYRDEWARTGFRDALKWYRAQTASSSSTAAGRDMLLFAGRRIEVPCAFISGQLDWGNYQQPGALEGYEDPEVVREGCFRGATLVEGAGHWVQQEQPDVVVRELLRFFKGL